MQVAITLDQHEKQIQVGKRNGVMGALQIGKALEGIREGNLWVVSGAKSFEAYVSAAHGFSKSTTYNLIGVYREYGPHLLSEPALQSVDHSRLIRLLPFTTPENKEDLLNAAVHCPDLRAFENNLRNLQGKAGTDDPHTHEWDPIRYEVCRICNLKRKVVDK